MLIALLSVLLTAEPAAQHIGRWRAIIEVCVGEACETLVGIDEFISREQCLSYGQQASARLIAEARRRNLQMTLRGQCVDSAPAGYDA